MIPLLSAPPDGDRKPKMPMRPPGWRWNTPLEYDSHGFLQPRPRPERAAVAMGAHVHESAQRFHEGAQPWSCHAGAALAVVSHTAPRGGVRDRRLTLVAF